MQDRIPTEDRWPTILVVDDDPAVRNSLSFSLRLEGYAVRLYANGAELLDDRSPPAGGCLVIDYQMPDMTGLEVIAALRNRKVSVPAILITTDPNAVVRRHAAEVGVRVIEKPLLGDSLFTAIRETIHR